jgi:hypothetical protein
MAIKITGIQTNNAGLQKLLGFLASEDNRNYAGGDIGVFRFISAELVENRRDLYRVELEQSVAEPSEQRIAPYQDMAKLLAEVTHQGNYL